MSAIRFQSIFPSERGTEITLNIWDTDYAGSPTDFNTGSEGYMLGYAASGFEQSAQFMATQCDFTFLIENATHEAIITDFVASQEGRFLVEIRESAPFVADHLVWAGMILLDISAYDEIDYPIPFHIKAVDGLGTLKEVPFKDTGGPYTGKEKLIKFLTRALSKISYVSEFYGSGDVFLKTSVDWWEETQTNSSSGVDTLDQTYVNNAAYYVYDKAVLNFQSCYDVIKDILATLECRITYAEGSFWIEQLSYRSTNTIIQRKYDIDGVFIAASNYNSPNDIDQTAAGALLNLGQYEFTAPISEARHTFNANERRNFFAGAENVDESHTAVDTFYVPIHANGGATTLRMTGNLMVRIKSLIPDPSYLTPFKPFVGVMRINLFLNSVGLQRLYTLQTSYQVTYEPPTWDATPGCYIIQPFTGGGFLSNTTSDFYTFMQAVDIMSPVLPENTETFTFSIEFTALERYDGGTYSLSDFEIEYDLTDLWLEAYSYGSPQLSDDVHVYSTLNTDTHNTLIWKSESLIGSSTNPNTIGALWVKPGADYQLAGAWGPGVATPTYDYLGQLLTTTIASTHAKPARKLNGSLYGDIMALSRVVWQSENWILIGGTWDAVHNTFSGEWLEMKNTEGLTPSPPIKTQITSTTGEPIKTPKAGYGVHTTTPSTGADGWFGMSAPIGTMLIPVASALTLEDIQPGAITSLATVQTLEDYSFNTGDKLIIGNPFTGAFEQLTVTALSNSGDTAIAVSGTLVGSYPEKSPIVRLEYIGAGYSLPGGVDGQIFRRTGGKWAGYGSAALTDGHYLKWTLALGWHAAAVSAGSGTVTSVGLSLPSIFNVTVSPITTSGTLTAALATQAANLIFAGPTTGSAATPTFRALVAADVANNLLPLGKLAQINTLTFLANATGSTADVSAITVTQATAMLNLFTSALKGLVPASGGGTTNYLRADGTWAAPAGTGITGSLTSPRVPFASGASALTDDANFTWDNTNKRLILGTGTSAALLNLFAASVSGPWEALRASASVNGNMIMSLLNTHNANTNSNTLFQISTGGGSAGDPTLQFSIVGGAGTFALGLDNSDGDKFKIIPNSSTPSGSLNSGICVTNELVAKVGINKDAPLYPLDVDGVVRSKQYVGVAASWSSANVAFGSGNGTGGTLNSISGTLNAIQINWNTGTSPAANGLVLTIAYPTAFPTGLTFPVMMAKNALSASDFSKFYISNNSNLSFQITANGTLAAPPSGNYSFNILFGGIG